MKKRFIFDENFIKDKAKKGRLKWLIIGLAALVVIIVIIIIIFVSNNNDPTPVEPALPNYELKEELTIESGSLLPEVTDYFNALENIDLNEIIITYPEEFELTRDTSLCSPEEEEAIYSTEEPNFNAYDCVQSYLITPATYGITISLQEEEHTVLLNVLDTTAPTLTLNPVEIYAGEEYSLSDFVDTCTDLTGDCTIEYYSADTDENGNQIDYANITEVGEHEIRIIATDNYGNITNPVSTTLSILEVAGTLYTVNFNSNGGTEVSSKTVSENGNVIKPSDPTREGFSFLGWYLGDEEFDFKTQITSDITLTARWEEISEEPSNEVYVTSISLNFRTISLDIGESKTVTASVYPTNAVNRQVTWNSSNPNIATVTSGLITGVSAGTTTITATAGGISTSVQVVVSTGSSCTYGNTTYNQNYHLSVNLTRNNCAVNPNSSPNETVSVQEYTNLINDLSNMNIDATGNIYYDVTRLPIKNTAGTGLVGYQITIDVDVIDPDNPYRMMSARYIITADGGREFITNTICKDNVCLDDL